MGLSSALVDRARCIREDRTGAKIEGQPQVVPDIGPWFHARLEPADTSSRSDDGHWTRVARTWLICGRYDVHHQALTILATDYVQVYSDDVDTGEDNIWRITGDVTPMRRRKGIIGFEFNVVQVRETPTWLSPIPSGTP